MRTLSTKRLIILSVLLAATAFLAYGPAARSAAVITKAPLQVAFERLDGWSSAGSQFLGDTVTDALKLDDHIFQSYRNESGQVTLYVGYYRTAGKVGAAHDPLVCFTGQGWRIGERIRGEYSLGGKASSTISYSSMIAERQGERELIVYWFQTNGVTSSSTLGQKVAMVRDRFVGAGEDNAFVRISTSLGDESPEAGRKRIFAFIDSFYPAFRGYVVGKPGSERS
ncbi:exosortase C-terminal domain/associated protein EpsI [Geobacter pickeringii]|uniref:exosortase C-terminal domain/associated protein EpsI n=1 Tax=Geobacter pickeringii TaxID=345632 RepID=UPI00068D5198|nr:exosortase C-terminal domain/associated protein EpsI [Geobacter pickeringii]